VPFTRQVRCSRVSLLVHPGTAAKAGLVPESTSFDQMTRRAAMQANRAPRETTQQWVPIPSRKACGSVQVQRRRRAFSPGRITRNGFFRDARRKSEDDGSIGCLGTGAEMATRDQPASAWSRRRWVNGTPATTLEYSPGWPLVMALGASTMMWAIIVWCVLKFGAF
jgi:hypothetical protein